jgi:pimeloyl-ACP methyl ester carboxylesterase
MKRLFSNRAELLILSILTGFLIQGCGYLWMVSRQRALESKIKAAPTKSLTKELNPDKCITVYGVVKSLLLHNTPCAIVAFSFESGKQEIVDYHIIKSEGYYSLFLPEGQYYLYSFTDFNNNDTFETDECTGMYNNELVLSDSCNFSGIVGSIDFLVSSRPFKAHLKQFKLPLSPNYTDIDAAPFPSGTFRSLDDPIFSREVSMKGVFSPSDFIKIAPMYFYAIQKWNEKKTPIIFVHGYSGSPQEFRFIIEHIDTTKFQPWFFYYPSGQKLDKTGNLFYEIFLSGNIIKLRRKRLVIFAHSMGGLIARYALNKYSSLSRPDEQIDYISAGAPYGGTVEAEQGIKKMPVVIPSWLDLTTHSPFIEKLDSTPLSPNIRFFLFFSYKNNGPVISQNSDGTIPLISQLHLPAQKTALQVTGFNATHEGILLCPEMIEYLNDILR